MALARFFLAGGANSATIAAVVASKAPTPAPVTNRISPNAPVDATDAVIAMPTANHATEPIMSLRLPMRSPIAPAASAPTSTPIRA